MEDYSNLSVKEIKQKLNYYLVKGYDWMYYRKDSGNPIIYMTKKKGVEEISVEIEAAREIRGLLKVLEEKGN